MLRNVVLLCIAFQQLCKPRPKCERKYGDRMHGKVTISSEFNLTPNGLGISINASDRYFHSLWTANCVLEFNLWPLHWAELFLSC